MGIMDEIFGINKKASKSPVCASCGKPVAAIQRQMGGIKMFEGTECAGCGKAYCLHCHNFGIQGPKCPGCGEYRLGPLMRAA
jgi:hypothetical protein